MSDVVKREAGALAIQPDQTYWNQQQQAALQQIGIRGASDGDLAVFLTYAQKTGLDPWSRQLYMINRGGKWGIQASIDGLRVVAQRSGDYAGQVGPEWCGKDGKWRDVWLEDVPPSAARVGVMRRGWAQPQYAVALLKEYSAGGNMWRDKPALMLAKCAEALALRKAFPHDLSGIYTSDEMGRADAPEQPSAPVQAAPQPARDWEDEIDATNDVDALTALGREAKQAGAMTDELVEYFRTRRDVLTATDVTEAEIVEEPTEQMGGDGWPTPAPIPS